MQQITLIHTLPFTITMSVQHAYPNLKYTMQIIKIYASNQTELHPAVGLGGLRPSRPPQTMEHPPHPSIFEEK